jgi:hypothetical protein
MTALVFCLVVAAMCLAIATALQAHWTGWFYYGEHRS